MDDKAIVVLVDPVTITVGDRMAGKQLLFVCFRLEDSVWKKTII